MIASPDAGRRLHRLNPLVLAVAAGKGGVGKSTSVLYIATLTARLLGGTEDDPAVGIIDRDESHNLTKRLELEPDLLRPGVVLLPGQELPPAGCGLDLVVIDTPPGHLSIDSLRQAQLVVVPVLPETNGVINLTEYLDNLELHRITVSPDMRLVALLPTMLMRTLTHAQRLDDIRAIAAHHRPPLTVLPPVPRRTRIEGLDLDAPEYVAPAKELFHHAGIATATACAD